jgi:hypothetical protein
MPEGFVIPSDDTQPVRRQQFNRLEDYQAAVGGWIEDVEVPEAGVTFYVDENGLGNRRKANRRVNCLWRYFTPQLGRDALLLGDAVVVGLPDEDGETTDVPAELADLIGNARDYVVETRAGRDAPWLRAPSLHDDYLEAVVWAVLVLETSPEGCEARITAA